MEIVHQVRYNTFNEGFAQILKFINRKHIITLHERNIIKLLEPLNSQVALSTLITR